MADLLDPVGSLVPLRKDEVEFLSAVAKRAFQSVLRHPDPIGVRTNEERRRDSPAGTLYVASLAFQLPDPVRHSREIPRRASSSVPSWSPSEKYRVVAFQNDRPSWEDLPGIVEDFLQEGKRLGALPHFVLLNELAHAFEQRSRLGAKWAELAAAYKTYIIPGTFHCTSELFGVAPLYCPDPGLEAHALKQNSAVKLKERIRTPDSRELFLFDTDFGNIVVWICLDMYDPGLVLKFLNATHRFTGKTQDRAKIDREISLVLVPAYSTDSEENIRNCVKTISRFSKTAMICTNSYLPDQRLESHGFSCGEPLPEVLQKTYELPGLPGDFCRATLYGIDMRELEKHQAANYEQNGVFSNTFSTIINGGPYAVRDLPDSD
jgi:hypothetical protein